MNLFEVTIRVLGGFLAAFHLSGGDPLFLARAAELAVRLQPAFDSASGVPPGGWQGLACAAELPRHAPPSRCWPCCNALGRQVWVCASTQQWQLHVRRATRGVAAQGCPTRT